MVVEITASLHTFHWVPFWQERGNPARVYRLSWCGVTSKLDAVATKKCSREQALKILWLVSAQQNVSMKSGYQILYFLGMQP